MRSVAGAQWVTLRKGIYLFPMQFRDMEEEDEFSASENDVFRVRLPVAAGLMLFASLLVWVLYGLGCTYGWISLHYELITNAFHPLCALLTLLILYLLAAPWLTSSQHHLEVIFYLVSIFVSALHPLLSLRLHAVHVGALLLVFLGLVVRWRGDPDDRRVRHQLQVLARAPSLG